MTPYARISLIVGLILPPLLGAVCCLIFLILCRILSINLNSLPYAILGSVGITLLLAPLAGWRLMAGQRLPDALADRYIPVLLLPPLIYLMAASFYWPILERQNLHVYLYYVLYGAVILWFPFALGVFGGARKSAPARKKCHGLIRMVGYIGLAGSIIGANLYDIASNTLYGTPDNTGKKIFLPDYFPFKTKELLAAPATPPSLRIADEYPRISGDIHLLPLYGAVVQAVYAIRSDESYADFAPKTDDESRPASPAPHVRDVVSYFEGIESPLEFLKHNDINIAFGDLSAARQFIAGLTDEVPELTPIARDALVFFVHAENPVTNLYLEQIRDIYTGAIQSWDEIGGPNTEILAFQSGDERTQRALKDMVMRGRKVIEPLKEEYILYNLSIVNQVAEYRNRTNALGYDFRWRASRLFPAGEIRFLTVDGIAPTPENIRNGTYPLIRPLVMATRQKPDKNVAALRDWICGPEGQALIDRTGFVSIKNGIGEKEKKKGD